MRRRLLFHPDLEVDLQVDLQRIARETYQQAAALGLPLLVGSAFADQHSVSWETPAGEQMDEIDRIIAEAR